MQDSIMRTLIRLRDELIQKRRSYKGQLDVQATIGHRQTIDRKINELTQRIDEVNDSITLRMSETAEKDSKDVPTDRCNKQ